MASTKSKSTKSTPKPKPSKTAKPKQPAAKTAKPKTAKPTKPASARRPEFTSAEKRATELVTVGADGKPIGRAPIGTPKMGRVSDTVVGRRRPVDVVRSVVFGPKPKRDQSAKAALDTLTKYAGAKIGQTDLPDGARARLAACALELGPPAVHKMNGRAMAAALVALASVKRDK